MATTALAKDNFAQTVNGEGIVMVDFWAGWCGPDRRFAPVSEQASQTHLDIVFGTVDTEGGAGAASYIWSRRSRKPCNLRTLLSAVAGRGRSGRAVSAGHRPDDPRISSGCRLGYVAMSGRLAVRSRVAGES